MKDWEELAACKGMHPSLFTLPDYCGNMKSDMGKAARDAILKGLEVCAVCPVIGPCGADASYDDRRYTTRGGNPPGALHSFLRK